MAQGVRNPPANAEKAINLGSVPGLGRSPGGGRGNPLHILDWRILWTEDPGRLQGLKELDTTEAQIDTIYRGL